MSGVSALLWQAALLLLGAYFIGAFLGCWLRRRFNAPPQVAMESPTILSPSARTVTAANASSSDRFGRALDGGDRPAPPAAEAIETVPTSKNGGGNPAVGGEGDAASQTATSRSAAPTGSADLLARIPPEEPPVTVGAPASAPLAQVPPEEPEPAPVAAPTHPPTVDLTPPMSASAAAAAARAARLAVSNRPTPDAPPLAASPHSDLPISTTEKMEQLTPPATTDLPASSGSGGQATVAAQIDNSIVSVSDAPDDLTLIKGVTDIEAAVLRDAGFATFSAIADWSPSDVSRVNAMVAGERRVSRENWIEQAQLLKDGHGTAYTSSVLANVTPRPEKVVTANPDASLAGAPAARATNSIGSDDEISNRIASSSSDDEVDEPFSELPAESTKPEAVVVSEPTAVPDVSARAAFARQRGGYADDLQQIDGINAEIEKLLNEQGVTRIAQIAGWPPEEEQRLDRMLGGMNRIRRENWVGQARRISGFSEIEDRPVHDQEAAPNAASAEPVADDSPTEEVTTSDVAAPVGDASDPNDAPTETRASESNVLPLGNAASTARSNVSTFRSVRSNALLGDKPSIDPSGPGDDLKRIRGIGVLIEKRLRAMGYTSYEQIGSWTQSDVDRVNQKLDFRGRIERENWIEQARILAAGGQTEFSRRQERDDS